ncbi:MAG: ATP-binding protein [Deltaproteobacteria bacterium]|nr:ATP-binding protein [Deltaproteobacteria bacterium]
MKMYTATIPGSALKVRSRESYYARQKRLFVLLVILVAIIPLLFISWTASHFYQKSWLDKTTVELTSLANSRREIIDLFLDSQENILAGYAELYDLAWLSTPGNLEKLFKAMNHQGVIVDLGLIAKDGSHRSYTGPFAADLKDKNYAATRWFAEVMQNGRYISDVFTGYRAVPHFIVAVTDPTRSWVLRATINSELFNALLASAEVGPGGDAFILNRQDELQTPSRQGLTALPAGEKGLLATGGGLTIHHSQGALYATTGMKNNAWTLVLKTDIATSLADFYRARQRDHLIIACAALLILAVSTFLVRSMMNKVEGADQQRMLLYDRIRYSEKMALIGRMAANVAHEINNPLQIIGDQAGWLDELLSEEDPANLKNTEEYRIAFAKIKAQVKRASTITHRLLGFSRSTDGLKSATKINTLVEETVSFLEKEAANHRIAIRRNLGSGLPEITTDTTQLQQVFLNILNNAFDAIGNDGAVTISTRLDGKQLAVEFADSGPGLPEEVLKKVFEPFFTTKKAGSGTGIGLAISYSIVERLGGSIEVRNGMQGGCVFRVNLPVAA